MKAYVHYLAEAYAPALVHFNIPASFCRTTFTAIATCCTAAA